MKSLIKNNIFYKIAQLFYGELFNRNNSIKKSSIALKKLNLTNGGSTRKKESMKNMLDSTGHEMSATGFGRTSVKFEDDH